MPPRGHSSSSHSSRSSSSRSSFRSSSSRSYSSRSSTGRSGSRGPSPHTGTSWSGKPAAPHRQRVNQPTGFVSVDNSRPRHVYGRRHEYVFYPVAWTDSATGTYYEKGYYDENGKHYEDVSFVKNGKYENVLCHCSYCGQDALLNIEANSIGAKSLQCPHCGAPMEIRSQLDEELLPEESAPRAQQAEQPRKKHRGLIALLVLMMLYTLGRRELAKKEPSYPEPVQVLQQSGYDEPSNVELFGSTVYLRESGSGAYQITDDSAGADKTLVWLSYEDSYYDAESDCYLWYNTEVEPAVWQYWYEGVSSDFGDYGWMEHDESGWYIEQDYGDWIELPASYDASQLWYFE